MGTECIRCATMSVECRDYFISLRILEQADRTAHEAGVFRSQQLAWINAECVCGVSQPDEKLGEAQEGWT